jgi:hypothetical protein
MTKQVWEFSAPPTGGEPYWHWNDEIIELTKDFRALLDKYFEEKLKAVLDQYPLPEIGHIQTALESELQFLFDRYFNDKCMEVF